MSKALVACFSASGVTAKLAKALASATDADLFEIKPVTPYTSKDLNWMDKTSRSTMEMQDKSSRPEMAETLSSCAQYDTVFVGFPIWWYIAPTIVNTFLEGCDLTGKTDTKFEYSSINVKAESLDAVSDVEQSIKDLGYSTYSMQSMRDELNKQTRQIELMLGGLGAISLLVAAIGITNTMIMSISERTKEIGIMKALGCYVKDIRTMFLCEAGAIGLVGGLIACLISALGSLSINLLSFGGFSMENVGKAIMGGDDVSRISVIPWWLFVVAVLFSILVGILAGLGPANKAVKIPALDAIKNEQ